MMRFFKAMMIALLVLMLSVPAYAEHTVDEVRAQYNSITSTRQLYGDSGTISDAAAQSMLELAQFMRWLAYVEEPLEISADFSQLAQDGALLLAAADTPAHALPQPEGFSDELYVSASAGIQGSNIASINWMDTDVLVAALEYFQRDEGAHNRFTLGHRRWLLSPALQHTGFGLANAESGMTYVTMYVHDFTAENVHVWDHIAWPSAGAFPAEYLYDQTPWSVILSDRVYSDEHPNLKITVSCEQTGETFVMDRMAQEDTSDAYWINTDGYGLGYALIFRPATAAEFEQNQVWHVVIEGLNKLDGSLGAIEYDVNMMALEPIPVRLIELNSSEASMKIATTLSLSASVVPPWADDVSVHWHSSDDTVACVDENGCVTAIGAGTCVITASGADNQSAECTITVTAE